MDVLVIIVRPLKSTYQSPSQALQALSLGALHWGVGGVLGPPAPLPTERGWDLPAPFVAKSWESTQPKK